MTQEHQEHEETLARLKEGAKKLREQGGETHVTICRKEDIREGESKEEDCPLPPSGWYCTRQKGHGGSCAALPRDQEEKKISCNCPHRPAAHDYLTQQCNNCSECTGLVREARPCDMSPDMSRKCATHGKLLLLCPVGIRTLLAQRVAEQILKSREATKKLWEKGYNEGMEAERERLRKVVVALPHWERRISRSLVLKIFTTTKEEE